MNKNPYRNVKRLPKPPKKRKLCDVCKKETLWAYNPNTLHSECDGCGSRGFSLKKPEAKPNA